MNSITVFGEKNEQHWIINVGSSDNFKNSKDLNIWGFKSLGANGRNNHKSFMTSVKLGDKLWFVQKNKYIAVATYTTHDKRILGNLVNITMTNEELGWSKGDWDYELHYHNLYSIEELKLSANFRGQCSIRKYKKKVDDDDTVDLIKEYATIEKYRKIILGY